MTDNSSAANSSPAASSSGDVDEHGFPRRGMLYKGVAMILGAIITIIPIVPVVGMVLDPLLRKKRAVGPTGPKVDADKFIEVAKLAQLKVGEPVQMPVIADQRDFWNTFPNQAVGSVYLTLQPDGKIECFNARCPHLGCTVNFRSGDNIFYCPCHDSSFNADGTRKNDIPPRDLDPLEVKQNDDGGILVKFENFRVGVHDRTVV
ncbi:MAG: Rieske (2Fe-2S) protein [Planctomycetaceae bacterium]